MKSYSRFRAKIKELEENSLPSDKIESELENIWTLLIEMDATVPGSEDEDPSFEAAEQRYIEGYGESKQKFIDSGIDRYRECREYAMQNFRRKGRKK